ncbi:MAG: YVTN family beta-propeller domain-containing protein [Acidobacteria bacterium]|nr:MAG: YVTN family beta-propeller domain-containing protein [Acidobacteriota bacterium]
MRKLFLLAVLLVTVSAIAAGTGYHILKEIKVGGEGGWDYLTMDSAARRLYVSHTNKVNVIDPDAGKVVGEIPDTQGVHGIAIAPGLNRGFTSNGRGNNVTIFDLKTLKPIGTPVMTGENPDSIRFEPNSGRVFTFNGRSKDSTAIDAKTGKVVGTIPMGGKPEFSVADGKGKIYVNIEDTSEVVEIDAAKASVTKRYSLKPCDGPSGLAIDVKNRKLFSVCGNRLMIVSDPDSGKVLATPAIGQGSDGVAFDPSTGSNGDGTLTIVHEMGGKWEVLENVATARGARTITLDEKTHNVYVPVAEPAPAPAGGGRGRGYVPDSFKVLVVGK